MTDRVRALVAAHEDCFARTCVPGHVTGSAWIVSDDGARVLLLHHRKLGIWLQPGGHADGDADVLRVAMREAEEETGIPGLKAVDPHTPLDVDVHLIPARHDAAGAQIDPAHEHHDIRFLLVAPPGAEPVVSDESHAVRWVPLPELEAWTTETSILRMAQKAAQRQDK
ncbi:NUDIX domain protein [Pirellulimonas nuda]|uniref:NUDIX domain protein n=2 Tax=Pirellulimonas nuda TaxID=2528009 RepID=A0A518D6Z1_9BACT|nr:NUDIX domain protein [Pirellulimonas nuda]